jgi:hypothetical protein
MVRDQVVKTLVQGIYGFDEHCRGLISTRLKWLRVAPILPEVRLKQPILLGQNTIEACIHEADSTP